MMYKRLNYLFKLCNRNRLKINKTLIDSIEKSHVMCIDAFLKINFEKQKPKLRLCKDNNFKINLKYHINEPYNWYL